MDVKHKAESAAAAACKIASTLGRWKQGKKERGREENSYCI